MIKSEFERSLSASTKYCWKLKSLAQSRPVGYPRRAAIVSQGVANAWVMGAVPRRDDGQRDGVEKFDTRAEFCSLALGSLGTSAIPSRYEKGFFAGCFEKLILGSSIPAGRRKRELSEGSLKSRSQGGVSGQGVMIAFVVGPLCWEAGRGFDTAVWSG